MINFIFGSNGSGKTAEILKLLEADAKNGRQAILIVPEQEAVQAERITLDVLPPYAQLTTEVLNFSRLYNRVCREYGGLCYSYVTKPLKQLFMWRTLKVTAPLLGEYAENAASDPSFASTMLSAVSEMKYACIAPEELEEAAAECDGSLGARLKDIALIYGTYNTLVSESYSDSSDDLSRLCDMLDEHNFFKGKNVYIDSFTSFTAVEHRVIERIFRDADSTCVTIPLNDKNYSDISTASIEQSFRTLKKSANRYGGHTDTVLRIAGLATHPSIVRLYENIWQLEGDGGEFPSCEGRIGMEICDTPYAEAEATAAHVLELLASGARCRDIVIITRDAEKYRGIIEPALENADIPYFFSEKTDVCALPPIKFILTAIRIDQYNWRKNDVIAHVKTGLCPFSARELDLFEEYINTWNISGSRFTDGDWSMNPDGFAQRLSPRGKSILETANGVRRRLCEPLTEFFIMLESAQSASEKCSAVRSYAERAGLRERLEELASRELSFGNKKGASELASAYDLIISTLTQLEDALKDERISTDELYTVLKTVFEQTEIGTIPTSADEVTVGSASMLRSASPKYAFVIGLCDGEFPATVTDEGLLSDNDRSVLSEHGLDLGDSEEVRSSNELLYVKNAFAAPREKLFLMTSRYGVNGESRSPSLPFLRASKLFCDLIPHNCRTDELAFLAGSPKSAASHLRTVSDSADRAAVRAAVAEYLPLAARLSESSVEASECRIEPRIVRELIGDRIYISPSSLEKYVRCPFSYYAGYMLSLREKKYGRFKANDFGSFIHYVMEHAVSFAVPTEDATELPTREEIERKVSECVAEYVRAIAPDEALKTKRMEHLYEKLRRLSLLLINDIVREFADSDFRPAFFELHTDGADGAPMPLRLPLDNGAQFVLKGFIDRVDLWKSGEDVYVRIVDYKTGSKEFRLSDVEHGLNTQMLLYLFSVCRAPGARLKTAAGLDGDSLPIPAGIVYLSSALPRIELNDYSASEEDIFELAEKKLSRNGILLNDDALLNAMSHSGSREILLGAVKKNGTFTGRSLIDEKEFKELYSKLEKTLTEIGNSIYAGIADCRPLEYGDVDPCKYCNARPMCRKEL